MSTTSNMKKFGRGYVLDFNALMNDVRSPIPSDEGAASSTSATTTSAPPTTGFGAADGRNRHPLTSSHEHDSHGETQNGSGADATPSPTDEDLLDASQGMQRRPARMSVSRTGRLKNRDRQRISVLEASEFYGVKPEAASLSSVVRGSNAGQPPLPTDRDANGRKATDATAAVGLPSETLADFDGVIAALDNSVPTNRVTNCYSF